MIEHVAEPERVLDELRRVLRPDGLLVISTPNRDVFTPGNPHHLHELTPASWRTRWGGAFARWRCAARTPGSRPACSTTSASPRVAMRRSRALELRKLVSDEPGRETYTLGARLGRPAAGATGGSLALTSDVDLRGWTEHWDAQHAGDRGEGPRAAELDGRVHAIASELEDLQRRYETIVSSKSWRLTGLLRRAAGAVRGRRAGV